METETERQGVFPYRETRRGDKCKERETWVHGEGYRERETGGGIQKGRETWVHGEGDRESENETKIY